MDDHKNIDEATGLETTGHSWDGIRELNQPLPKWWLYVFYATIIWAIGYWIVYPAWPTSSDYTKGIWGYSQRAAVVDQMSMARKAQDTYRNALDKTALTEISANPDLLNFSLAGGKAAFGDNCAPCHGRGAQGSKGYPNLNDDSWLWGGTLDDIHKTLRVGVRSTHEDTRTSDMPKFGIDKLLEPGQINDVAEYVLSLTSRSTSPEAVERGKAVFAEQCVACHGEQGKGNKELGSPNLTDGIWLYGDKKEDVVESIRTGRGGVMPFWENRLDPITIKQLAVYVHSLGGGK